jgi:hypothetical protein
LLNLAPPLKFFDWSAPFSADEGTEDRIKLALGRWEFLAENEDTLGAFWHHFTTPPRDARRIFQRPEAFGTAAGEMVIRRNRLLHPDKESGRFIPAPLCSGYFHPLRRAAGGGRRFTRGGFAPVLEPPVVIKASVDLDLWAPVLVDKKSHPI